VLLVDLPSSGKAQTRTIALNPRRDLHVLEWRFDEPLRQAPDQPHRNDYLCIHLLDETMVYDAMHRLQQAFPNLLHLERPALHHSLASEPPGVDRRKIDPVELFAGFYREVTGQELKAEQRQSFIQIVNAMNSPKVMQEAA
jgi:exonuclease SbcD